MALLTKSNYLLGLQCPKLLWISIHDKAQLPEKSDSSLFTMEQGTKVGILAQSLFPDGINAQRGDFKESLEISKLSLQENKPLFEAGFLYNDCYSRADILEPGNGRWNIIEVKSSTKVKDINIEDVAFQKYCYESSGLKINRCYLMHINNEFIKHGEIDPKEFFTKEDITEKVELIEVEENIKKLKEVMKQKECPQLTIGKYCNEPYACGMIKSCWQDLPEDNVFTLYRGGKKSFDLFQSGILSIKDIPEDCKLTGKQQIQCECEKTKKIHLDKKAIQTFLKKLTPPLYYLDFETYSTAIPIYDGLKPYQQLPFQFSLHIVDKETKHISFLAEGKEDPRKEFAKKIKESLGEKGSIIVYNQSFEISRIRELAEMFPEYKDWAEKTIQRVIDLLEPFRNFHFYSKEQQGSASIKHVLPTLTGKSYSDLEIKEGGTASYEYYRITHEQATEEEIKEIRKNLEIYCGLDTEGMIWIVDKLRELIKVK